MTSGMPVLRNGVSEGAQQQQYGDLGRRSLPTGLMGRTDSSCGHGTAESGESAAVRGSERGEQ